MRGRIFTFYLYRGRLRLCAVYVVSATLSSTAQDLTHSSFDGEEPVIRTKTICLRVTTCTVTHEVIGHPEWYNTHISTLQYWTRLWICVRIVQSKTRCKRSGSSHSVPGHPHHHLFRLGYRCAPDCSSCGYSGARLIRRADGCSGSRDRKARKVSNAMPIVVYQCAMSTPTQERRSAIEAVP